VLFSTPASAGQAKPASKSASSTPESRGAEKVYQGAAPKVVYLITRKSGELRARASGIILTADGYISTNYHALQGADAVEIRYFPDPEDPDNYQSFNGAKLLYADAKHDIAVLKVNAKSLPFLECSPNTNCEASHGPECIRDWQPKGPK
jgi:Trypsin-like serine proteases, typically periplasmic, contain C-terminal PDZ domain